MLQQIETDAELSIPMAFPWFALRVKSRSEGLAARALEHRGYTCFSPTYSVRRRWADRVKELDLPLFPGYLFCQMDPERRLPVITAPGVMEVVSFGRTPQEIPVEQINAIRHILSMGIQAQPWPYLAVGQTVQIVNGPLAGVQGMLVEIKSENRLVLSVDILQRSVAVQIQDQFVGPLRRAC